MTERTNERSKSRRILIRIIFVITVILAIALAGLVFYVIRNISDIKPVEPDIASKSDMISSVVSSEIVSSEISEIIPEPAGPTESEILFNERYERAKDVRLINFTHPNYDEAEDLVLLKDVLGSRYTINSSNFKLTRDAAYALKDMLDAAYDDGIKTFIINSAYRDRNTQQGFWDARLEKDPSYGDDVYSNPVKTVPAWASEHCTGLATDILCESVPHGTSDYKDTKEAAWLAENAYKYGFILRYPEDSTNITGVMFEPWHYRYVGKDAAKDIYESGLCLESYLESLGLPEEEDNAEP